MLVTRRAWFAAFLVPPAQFPAVNTNALAAVNATTTVNQDGTVTTTASDASLLSQVSTFWSHLSGCDTGS